MYLHHHFAKFICIQGQTKDHNETFHSQLERTTDSFSLISEYFGRCLFDDPSTVENQILRSKLASPAVLAPELAVPVVPTPPRLSPILSKPIVKKTTNPFDEDEDNMDYDDNKNPFKDDYDESKNPFANDT